MEQAADFNLWTFIMAAAAFGALGYFIWWRKRK